MARPATTAAGVHSFRAVPSDSPLVPWPSAHISRLAVSPRDIAKNGARKAAKW